MLKDSNIPSPSKTEVEHYLKLWDTLENYALQESSLRKLFSKTYPLNTNLDEVLIKVCSLNTFYSANIFDVFTIAQHIVGLNIDNSLLKDDLTVVNKIAIVRMKNGKSRNFYSFATKYCSHHRPTVYPIYDSYLEKMLIYFKKKDKFYDFSRQDLKSFAMYKNILLQFRTYYGLESFDLKQVDKYLWQAGKKYFPKTY